MPESGRRIGISRHLRTGVVHRRVVQRRGVGPAARQLVEGGKLHRGAVRHAQPRLGELLDMLGRGDMLPFGFQHADMAALLGDAGD